MPFCNSTLWSSEPGSGVRIEELQDVQRQLALDDLDIAEDRCLAVAGKADDVAGAGDGAVLAPLLQHVPVFGDLVLVLLGGDEIVGIDVLQPDEDPAHAGLSRPFR